MTTNFPSSADAFTNPTSADTLDNPPHDQQHADINDAMEAVQTSLLDGAPLHIDDANERVGIGTVAPSTELEVDGTVTATEFVGHLQGPTHIQVKNTSGGSLSKGTPVYATGSVGASGAVEVQASLAGTASTMPALGLLDETLANNAEGSATILGVVRQVDTSSYSVNDSLYVAVSGGLTNVRPTGASELVQKIGRVVRADASTGEVLVLGAGRANDVPNNIVAGGLTIDTDTLHVDSTNDRVGIGTTTPGAPLHVSSTAGEGVRIQKSNNDQQGSYIGMWDDDQRLGYIGYAGTDDIYLENEASAGKTFLSTGGSVRLAIDSSGNVGINDTTPSYTLDVDGDINATGDVRVAGNPVGMVLVKSHTIGNGVSSVTVTNAFSATFKNYLVIITAMAGSSVQNLLVQVGGSTVGYYGTSTRTLFTSTSVSVINKYGDTEFYAGEVSTTGNAFYELRFFQPYESETTKFDARSFGGGYWVNFGGLQNSTSSHTSFKMFPASGTLTGGTLQIYGYNNG